jgi:hypothetical protein
MHSYTRASTSKGIGRCAKLAGYPQGSQFAASARKRARRKDVKAMVAELQKPVKEKLAKTIEANFAWATEKLMSIASAKLDPWNIKASDKIRAIDRGNNFPIGGLRDDNNGIANVDIDRTKSYRCR